MFPIRVTASSGYPRSFVIANSLAWSREPKAFLKLMYNRYMSWFVNFASSSVAMRSWSCLDVFLSALNPSWLSCRIWCFSPYIDNMNIRILVKNLYIVFASAIGIWFDSFEGSPFLYRSIIKLIFHDAGICFYL